MPQSFPNPPAPDALLNHYPIILSGAMASELPISWISAKKFSNSPLSPPQFLTRRGSVWAVFVTEFGFWGGGEERQDSRCNGAILKKM